jgi:peptidoglycan/xylan/chitin deacetylase (PgdA/CDA1 family)
VAGSLVAASAAAAAAAAHAAPARPYDAAPPPAAASPGPVEAAPPAFGAATRPLPTGCRRGGNPLRFNGSRRRKVVALTFDDGPSAYTTDVIRVLKRKKVKATFFVLGNQIPGREGVLRRQLKLGYEIGDHSFNHAAYAGGGAEATRQFRRTNARIRRATGFTPCLFRPPYGSYNRDLVGRARARGMMTIVWDVDPQDWATPGSGTIYRRIVRAVSPGSIVLMHDGGGPRRQTVAALPRVIDTLRARGYRFATVTGLLRHRFVYPD